MTTISERQRELLQYIHRHMRENGVTPSYREIGDALGIRSTNGVAEHIRALLQRGYLARVGATGKSALARALVLTDQAEAELGVQSRDDGGDWLDVPVYGHIAAGMPAFSEEHHEETLRVDSCMIPGGKKTFALRVYGESMIEDGIRPGDYLFVQNQLEVRNGDTAVVMVGGECTVKRYYKEDGRIRLQPANATMQPIIVPASDPRAVQIVGVVVGLYRKMH